MELTVLVDNHASRGQPCRAEHGAAFYLEDGEARILFDTGQSDLVLENAAALGIDLGRLTHVVLSHGHYDHAGGLGALLDRFDLSRAVLIAHPDAFLPRRKGEKNMAGPCTLRDLKGRIGLRLSRTPLALTERLVFLGEIPRINAFEAGYTLGQCHRDGVWVPDDLRDDSALAFRGREGLFVITGCSHSGVCNILDHALAICGEDRVRGILGGFHLQEPGPRLEETVARLGRYEIPRLCPCHCVSLEAKARMLRELPVEEVGVGFRLTAV